MSKDTKKKNEHGRKGKHRKHRKAVAEMATVADVINSPELRMARNELAGSKAVLTEIRAIADKSRAKDCKAIVELIDGSHLLPVYA
jgi:hypothetical protein